MTKKAVIDKDLKQIARIEKATSKVSYGLLPIGLAVLFLLAVFFTVHVITGEVSNSTIIIIAGVLGAYMALNIGANDVANNVSPAVGSKALTMVGALIIAAIFEAAGAVIAGGEVVSTISKGIINKEFIPDSKTFILLMLSALLAAALWINLATYLGAPVSTTHSIVGGVLGAGIFSAGFAAVDWTTMSKIAASWIISPVLGGIIAATIYRFIKAVILSKNDMLEASRSWVPILVSTMAAAFTMYLMIKGFKRVWKPDAKTIWLTGITIFLVLPFFIRPFVKSAITNLENRARGVNQLFTLPLIISAALLSFAHGSNDVANAIGPLAAIVSSSTEGVVSTKVDIPGWVMFIGALGISVGLILFGPKIILTVGEKITRIDRVRAFCIALSAALTVIAASTLGLPVSSTHITVGAVFGVGLYREFSNHKKRKNGKKSGGKKLEKRKLVRRSYIISIFSAWIITVPSAAVLSALICFILKNFVSDSIF